MGIYHLTQWLPCEVADGVAPGDLVATVTATASRRVEVMSDLGWWTISGESILHMLRRVADGDDPDLVYTEEYANSEHEHYGGLGD